MTELVDGPVHVQPMRVVLLAGDAECVERHLIGTLGGQQVARLGVEGGAVTAVTLAVSETSVRYGNPAVLYSVSVRALVMLKSVPCWRSRLVFEHAIVGLADPHLVPEPRGPITGRGGRARALRGALVQVKAGPAGERVRRPGVGGAQELAARERLSRLARARELLLAVAEAYRAEHADVAPGELPIGDRRGHAAQERLLVDEPARVVLADRVVELAHDAAADAGAVLTWADDLDPGEAQEMRWARIRG